jgi:hypothetical protein
MSKPQDGSAASLVTVRSGIQPWPRRSPTPPAHLAHGSPHEEVGAALLRGSRSAAGSTLKPPATDHVIRLRRSA